MQNLATDVLHDLKKHCRVWQIATAIVTVIAIAELVVIMMM